MRSPVSFRSRFNFVQTSYKSRVRLTGALVAVGYHKRAREFKKPDGNQNAGRTRNSILNVVVELFPRYDSLGNLI